LCLDRADLCTAIRNLEGAPPPLCEALRQSAGFDAEHARILLGEEGARILDIMGTEHGFWRGLERAMQSLGYDQNILAVYDEGLRSGQALMTVPCAAARRYEIGNVLRARGAHAIIYFGAGTAETLSGP
jgi:hypothetical protein